MKYYNYYYRGIKRTVLDFKSTTGNMAMAGRVIDGSGAV